MKLSLDENKIEQCKGEKHYTGFYTVDKKNLTRLRLGYQRKFCSR